MRLIVVGTGQQMCGPLTYCYGRCTAGAGRDWACCTQAAGHEQRAPDWLADAPPELTVSALWLCVHDGVCMPASV